MDFLILFGEATPITYALTHKGGLVDVDLLVCERLPLLVPGVLLDLHRVVLQVGVVLGAGPTEDPTAGLLGHVQALGRLGGLAGRDV